MTAYTTTLSHYFERDDGESRALLKVRVINEPKTHWEPGCREVEPIRLEIDGRETCLIEHAELVEQIIENETIEPPELEYEEYAT